MCQVYLQLDFPHPWLGGEEGAAAGMYYGYLVGGRHQTFPLRDLTSQVWGPSQTLDAMAKEINKNT